MSEDELNTCRAVERLEALMAAARGIVPPQRGVLRPGAAASFPGPGAAASTAVPAAGSTPTWRPPSPAQADRLSSDRRWGYGVATPSRASAEAPTLSAPSLSARHAVGGAGGDTRGSAWRVFEAIFQPGRVRTVARTAPVPPLKPAATAVCRALVHADTPLWTDAPERDGVGTQLWRRYAIPTTREPAEAVFALLIRARHAIPPLHRFRHGTEACPERSTTLIIEVQRLIEGTGRRLSGPGMETEMRLQVSGLGESFWARLRACNECHPYGMDLILTCGRRLVALPRWTTVEV